MAKDTSYVEYIVYDVLGHIPGITSKAMFSGFGIYLDGAIIALVIDGELYFKVTKELRDSYVKAGYHPFTYLSHRSTAKGGDRNGKTTTLNYISVTAEDLENKEEIERRVEESYGVSVEK